MKVVYLSGGVGGARLLEGMARVLAPDQLTAIVNVGDDFEHLGLYVCPDLDTVLYTLAHLSRHAARLGPARRDLPRARDADALRRRGLVPARRQGPRAARDAHARGAHRASG